MNMQLRDLFERPTLAALPALAMLALFSGAVSAEGAIRHIDCTVAQVCNAAGSCEPGSMQVTFRMEPITTGADGAGSYTLEYGGTQAQMQALSDAGPFFWTAGTERNTLLASSDNEFLWHRLIVDPVPEATVRFLTCSFHQ